MSGLGYSGNSGTFYGSPSRQRSPAFKTAGKPYHSTRAHKSSESSTPHAPRQHKRAASSTGNDLMTRHGHPDTIQISVKDEEVDENSPPKLLTSAKQKLTVKQAWGNAPRHQDTPPKLVQPFRRTFGRHAPHGVPLLDLSSLNEPDDKLQPVRLLDFNDVTTQRSAVSWGGRSHQPSSPIGHMTTSDGHMTTLDGHMTTSDDHITTTEGHMTTDVEVTGVDRTSVVDKSSGRKLTPSVDKLPQAKTLLSNQLQLIEAKLMSLERGKLASFPQSKLPLSLPVDQTSLLHRPVVPQSHANLGVPEASLSKRLRFEARVLTQQGRDVHRELCGFLFLADNSLTVYEYRQFGKKSSALPLIQRGCYTHIIGHRKGQPLEINFIKKGSVIHFRTSDHPGLPSSLRTRPLVALMITSVDEKTKKQLLCEGRNPVEHHRIEAYLYAAPPPDEEKDTLLLSTLQGMLSSCLGGRATKTLVGVGREIRHLADDGGVISKAQLQQTLRKYHLSLTVEDMDRLCQLLVTMEITPPSGCGLYVDGCVDALVGRMSEDRLALIRTLFQRLDAHKSGTITFDEVSKFFNKGYFLTFGKVQRSTADIWDDFVECLFGTSTAISYADLEHYYLGVSIETCSDSEFYSLLRHCWTL